MDKYRLLPGNDNQETDETPLYEPRQSLQEDLTSNRRSPSRFLPGPFEWLLVASAILNIVLVPVCLVYVLKLNDNMPRTMSTVEPPSPYAKLTRDPEARWPYDTGYGPEITNHTLLDERWESINFGEGIVAIDHTWAREMNLGHSQDFPWDSTKGLYVITAYHTIHCLMTIHRLVYELHHDLPRTRSTEHALHCLAHMRTDAMCEADDFLLPTDRTQYMKTGPRGQPRVCKNWDELATWAKQHNACYQHISDDEEKFARERDEIERYFGCPDDSPYRERMLEYKTRKGY